VDVIETCTFRSNRLTLSEYGLSDQVLLINQTAARLARRLADEFSTPDHPRFVAGSMGPSGKLPSMNDPELSNITFDELAEIFSEQAEGLIRGGVDLLLIETSQDILEVKAVIDGIQRAFTKNRKKDPDPGSDHTRYHGQDAAGNRYFRCSGDTGKASDRCDRDELLHGT